MSGIYETPDGQKVHGDGRPVGSPLDPTQPSQTPRTDAAQKYYFSLSGQMQTMCVHQEFARTLELELVAALERVKELESHKFYVYITQQRDTLAARLTALEQDKQRLDWLDKHQRGWNGCSRNDIDAARNEAKP